MPACKVCGRWFAKIRDDEELCDKCEISLSRLSGYAVRHGRWMHTKKHLWYKNKDGSIDEWRLDVGFHNGPECQVCGEAVCMHCHPDWESMECEIGHYLCSVCGEVSIDAHENYCPNCGAKMDGGED